MKSTAGIALLGCGTVGGGVAELLRSRKAEVEARSGTSYEMVGIVRSAGDPLRLVEDPRTDLVVECIGGSAAALECIERALELGKHVVTANKQLLATQGPRLRALAAAHGVTIAYEASVASAVPILSTLKNALAGEEIFEIGGILSGTCNFVLDRMRERSTAASALLAAQKAGYAETDARDDLHGTDAAHKLAILVQHAFGQNVLSSQIARRGIEHVTCGDVRRAARDGFALKLLAHAYREGESLRAQVAPVLVPFGHPLAGVHNAENAVSLTGAACGTLFFHGAGAGRLPAASAVIGDIVCTLRIIASRAAAPLLSLTRPQRVLPAFDHLPAFAGYPIFKGAIHDEYPGTFALAAI